MTQVMVKEIKSMEDIEVGDIFYSSWGYDQTNIDFYKIVKKTKAMVEMRAIGQHYVEQTGFMAEYVVADPDNELFETDWVKPEDIKAGWEKVEVGVAECMSAQERGLIKVRTPAITRHRPQFYSYGTYIKIKGYRSASYWDGQKKYQSHYA